MWAAWRSAGNFDRYRRQDQPRCGGRARLGQVLLVGADALNIDYKTSTMATNGKVVKEGDWLTLTAAKAWCTAAKCRW